MIKFLHERDSYWKKFHAKSDKIQKIFFCTPVLAFQKISTSNISMEQNLSKIYPKEQKKDSKKGYCTNFRTTCWGLGSIL